MKHTICLVVGSVQLVAGVKILSEGQALVAGTKQSIQAQLSCQPAFLISLPALSAYLPCRPACFVFCLLLAFALQSGFLRQPQTVLTPKTGQAVCANNHSIFNMVSVYG